MLPVSHNILCSERSVRHKNDRTTYRSGAGGCRRSGRPRQKIFSAGGYPAAGKPSGGLSRHRHPRHRRRCPDSGQARRPLYHRRPDPLLPAAAGVFSPRRLVHRLSAARPAASRGAPLSGPGSGTGQPCHDPRRHRPHRRGEPAGDAAHGPRTAPPVPGLHPCLCPVHRRTGPHGAGDAGADTGCGGPHPAHRRHRHRCPGRPQPPAAMRHGTAQRHRPDPRLRCGQPPPRRGPRRSGRTGDRRRRAHCAPTCWRRQADRSRTCPAAAQICS